ncbi:tripartite motif-containing protein 75-like [Sorex fumeus]|uniref:tripartite motif-containing protein 75-like n=1 Tax=Sorex fumeus TaxID=62283 RepID=UPI0024ACA0AC|nr:tripartite motif-containing protein 75-like [Sorex fumeus]
MEEVWEALAKIQPDLICRICLDYINDPVTIDCGHSFCDSCIRMSWKDLQDTFPCPVCRQSRQEMRISANAQLGRLVDLAKLLHSSRTSQMAGAEEGRCEEHRQGVSLFCEDDQSWCVPCAPRALPTRATTSGLWPRQQLITDRGLVTASRPLKNQLVELQKLEVAQDRNLLQLRADMEKHRRQLASEFEQLTEFVEHEHEAALCRLAEEDKRLQQQLRANLEAYSDHISVLKDLRREVAERSVMYKEMVLRGKRGLQEHWADLQPPAVQPLRFSLRVSQDLQSVTCVRERPNGDGNPGPCEDYTPLVFLGREGFTSGRHYWEVQGGAKPEWAVGVCSVAPLAQNSRPLVAPMRCWTLQLQDGDYLAVSTGAVPLALRDQPTAIGVYLEWELGQLSFYNAADRSQLHSFTEPFAQELKPYFRVGPDCAPPLHIDAKEIYYKELQEEIISLS